VNVVSLSGQEFDRGETIMNEGLLFLAFWFGAATLHTFFDLKIRPLIRAHEEEF